VRDFRSRPGTGKCDKKEGGQEKRGEGGRVITGKRKGFKSWSTKFGKWQKGGKGNNPAD